MRRNTRPLRRLLDNLTGGDDAVFSNDSHRRYRYLLVRRVTNLPHKIVAFIMVNPSTATAKQNDHTITKCERFAAGMNASHLVVANLFAARSRDIRRLERMTDPIGPLNSIFLALALEADVVVVGWGSHRKTSLPIGLAAGQVADIAYRENKTLLCLGTTRDNDPLHPLGVSYNAGMVQWPVQVSF